MPEPTLHTWCPATEEIKPFKDALEELKRLNLLDITLQKPKNNATQIVSYNVRSLRKHIRDITSNQKLMASDVICLQETWLEQYEELYEKFNIADKKSKFVSVEEEI